MYIGDETYFKNLDNTGLEVEVVKQDNTSWSLEVLTPILVFDYRDIRWLRPWIIITTIQTQQTL